MIPNGSRVSCAACHVNPAGGGERNAFGKHVEELVTPNGEEPFWSPTLAAKDSDGDGFTNGRELQDPEGAWIPGADAPGDPNLVTNPGDAESKPAAAVTIPPPSDTTTTAAEEIPKPEGPFLELDFSTYLRRDEDIDGADWDGTFYTNVLVRDLIKDHLDMKFSGWGIWDIDGTGAYDRAIEDRSIRISEGYFDIRDLGPLLRMRLGRQYMPEVDYLHFDGVKWTVYDKKPISVFVFGGKPVTYYESTHGDWLGGGGVVWRPGWKMTHQFDAYALHEGGEDFALTAWRWNQYWGDGWRTNTRLRFLDDEIRDFRGYINKYFERWRLGVNLDYYLQPKARGVDKEPLSRDLAYYSHILGVRAPTHRIGGDLYKFIGDRWMVQAGGSIRRRVGSTGEDTYNSFESDEAHLSATRFNAFVKNLDATFGYQTVRNDEDHMHGLTGDLSYHPTEKWDFSLGTSYSHYTMDPIDFPTTLNGQPDLDLLLSDIRSEVYYFEARWRPNDKYQLRAQVDYNNSAALNGGALGLGLTFDYRLRHSLGGGDGK